MCSRTAGFAGCAVISVVYWFCAGIRAAYRPFWCDELYTWKIARLPSVAAIWAALENGTDQQMPLTDLLVRFAHWCFGTGGLATRLPALLGFWILLLALYVFLRRRLPAPYALVGMVFPMLTFAWTYAFEARAYAIVLGSAGVVLVAWQAAAEGRCRALSLVGILVGLAVALASHAFAVLLAIPFAVGEAVRSVQRRRLDYGIWIAFAAATPVALLYPQFLAPTRDWDLTGLQPTLADMPGFYVTMFKSAITPLLFAGLAACLMARGEKSEGGAERSLPLHEAASLLAFAVVPVVFFVAGRVSNRFVFFPRYGLICVIGVSCWLAVLIYRAAGSSRRVGTAVLVALVVWLAVARGKEAVTGMREPGLQFQKEKSSLLEALADGRPVWLNNPLVFMPADFYFPPDVLARLYLVLDLETAPGYRWQDLSDRQMRAVAANLPLRAHVETWKDFASRNQQFLLYAEEGDGHRRNYDLLLRGGWRMKLKAHKGGATVYEVSGTPDVPAHGQRGGAGR